ncbi:Uncharacterized protein TCM_045113 [Theobroma cacao]|uniref:Pentatricopeptide repeat-containing protein n=1 Tax=Theobroma cacao TaxID=3641 RepID=A0A061FSA7_THECC|nr:Uncharacterized protein TCM_045113 [Theobroma cacao]
MEKGPESPDNTIIAALCKDNRATEALKLSSEMRGQGIPPTVVTSNSLIHAMCNSCLWLFVKTIERLSVAQELFKEMMSTPGVVPNMIIYSALLYGLCTHGRIYDALGLFSVMRNNG